MTVRKIRRAAVAVATAALLMATGLTISLGPDQPLGARRAAADEPAALTEAREQLVFCQRLAAVGSTSAQRQRGRTCRDDAQRVIDSYATPTPTTTPPATTAPPTTTVAPTTTQPPPTTATPTPTVGPPTEGCPAFPLFPTPGSTAAGCTGFRHNVTESALRICPEADGEQDGHLTLPQVFDGCEMSGLLRIRSAGVVIRNSRLTGCVATHHTSRGEYHGLLVVDTEITGVCTSMAPVSDGSRWTCLRCYVHDTATGLDAGGEDVRIEDSYVTRMVYSDGAHQATIGMNHGRDVVIKHNNLNCFRVFPPGVPQNQGCSAALSVYDEGELDGVDVTENLLNAAGEYCAYSGGPAGRNVRFTHNRFGTVHHPQCGNSGPLHSWYPDNVGYVWTDNAFTDGRPIVR